jgi:hypothetical protein
MVCESWRQTEHKNVKRWQYIVLVLVLLAGLFVYLHRQDLGLVSPRGSESESGSSSLSLDSSETRPAAIRWETVERASEGFRIDLPAGYQEKHIPAYNEKGAAEQVTMIFSNPDAETTYAISWADNPPVMRTAERSPDRILDLARDNALLRSQTSKLSESRTNVASYPARDFTAKNAGGGIMTSRLVYTGQRLYMLTASFPSEHVRSEQNVARFFNSFAFTDANRIPETLPGAPAPQSGR